MRHEGGRVGRSVFDVVLIKPSRYDDDGYPIHWLKSSMTSGPLGSLWGIAEDCRRRNVLGDDVEIVITTIDETNSRVNVDKLTRKIRRHGGLVCMVGVQTNQFPRALDLAEVFRAGGVPVVIGGFHVSGCIAMLPSLTPELARAQEIGVGLFAGESEDGRFDEVLRDAKAGAMKPLYDNRATIPGLDGEPTPYLPAKFARRTLTECATFDLGRGCPFECSFCCIINVQGRRSRYRSPDDLEHIVRANAAVGVTDLFFADDNFARNRNWEALFDRLIALRAEGLKASLTIQVDTLAHRIAGFIDKAAQAGVAKVFIGLENVNPANLSAVKKRQNRITEYRDMLLDWKRHNVVITCGYIIGFPADTRASVLSDIDIVKEELPVDILYLGVLTPLPGSEDHKKMVDAGEWIDPDLNKYDLTTPVARHPNMSMEELAALHSEAWDRYYSEDHIERIMLRGAALGGDKRFTTADRICHTGDSPKIYNIRSMDCGFVRRRWRTERRPGTALEGRVSFALRQTQEIWLMVRMYLAYRRRHAQAVRIWGDPKRSAYRDEAITPSNDAESDTLDLFRKTRGGEGAVAKHRKQARTPVAA